MWQILAAILKGAATVGSKAIGLAGKGATAIGKGALGFGKGMLGMGNGTSALALGKTAAPALNASAMSMGNMLGKTLVADKVMGMVKGDKEENNTPNSITEFNRPNTIVNQLEEAPVQSTISAGNKSDLKSSPLSKLSAADIEYLKKMMRENNG